MEIIKFLLLFFSLIFFIENRLLNNIQNQKNNNKNLTKKRKLEEKKNIIEIEVNSNINSINFNFSFPSGTKIKINGIEYENLNTIFIGHFQNPIQIKFPDNFKGSCEGMFKDIQGIKSIKFINFKGCTNTIDMFKNCSSVEEIDLLSFDTDETIIKMNRMFLGCSSLTSIKFPQNFIKDNVDNICDMFNGCSILKSIDLSSFKTYKIQRMGHLFADCHSLESLDLSLFKIDNAIYIDNMLLNCNSLKSLNLSTFNANKVEAFNDMFTGCDSLNELIISNSFIKNDFKNIFPNFCFELNNDNSFLNNEILKQFNICSIIEIKIESNNEKEGFQFINFDPLKLNNYNIKMFVNNNKYNNFQNKINLNSGETLIKLNFPNDMKISCDEMFKDIKQIKSIEFKNFNICNSSKKMFSNCSLLETLNFFTFNTEQIEDMYRMFSGCTNLKTLGVETININNSKNTDNMFCDCKKLSIDKSHFNDSSFTCIEQCKGGLPYLIKEENICAKIV